MTFVAGMPVVAKRSYISPNSLVMRGTQWIVRDHPVGEYVRCWRTYDWFKGDEMLEAYEEADIPPTHLEQITGGERDDG